MSVPAQLVSYIAPAAPATRRPARGDEPFLRPEIGFTPAWFRQHTDVDFGERFHMDPAYRRDAARVLRRLLAERFPGLGIGLGGAAENDAPLDLLTGTHGACTVAAIYGVPIRYAPANWPASAHEYLTDVQVARLEPPDLDRNPHFERLMAQVEWIAAREGRVEGFINWQGILNNAHRLRGERLLTDLLEAPDLCRHLFACVAETMTQGLRRLHERQRARGVDLRFVTISNCLVNLVSPRTYRELLLPFDQQLAAVYGSIGIHNCAWNATRYLADYAQVAGVGYLDLGLSSNLAQARTLFPHARRALMYTPMDLAAKPWPDIEADFERIAREYGPADVVIADLEAGTPDQRVKDVFALCHRLSKTAPARED